MKIRIYYHLINHFAAQLVGFISALWAADFVSIIFEKKSQKNLWGLTGEKPILDMSSYHTLESVVSITIGFIVLLIVNYLFSKKLIVVVDISKKVVRAVKSRFKKPMSAPKTIN